MLGDLVKSLFKHRCKEDCVDVTLDYVSVKMGVEYLGDFMGTYYQTVAMNPSLHFEPPKIRYFCSKCEPF